MAQLKCTSLGCRCGRTALCCGLLTVLLILRERRSVTSGRSTKIITRLPCFSSCTNLGKTSGEGWRLGDQDISGRSVTLHDPGNFPDALVSLDTLWTSITQWLTISLMHQPTARLPDARGCNLVHRVWSRVCSPSVELVLILDFCRRVGRLACAGCNDLDETANLMTQTDLYEVYALEYLIPRGMQVTILPFTSYPLGCHNDSECRTQLRVWHTRDWVVRP